jgi:hypothetical protein
MPSNGVFKNFKSIQLKHQTLKQGQAMTKKSNRFQKRVPLKDRSNPFRCSLLLALRPIPAVDRLHIIAMQDTGVIDKLS